MGLWQVWDLCVRADSNTRAVLVVTTMLCDPVERDTPDVTRDSSESESLSGGKVDHILTEKYRYASGCFPTWARSTGHAHEQRSATYSPNVCFFDPKIKTQELRHAATLVGQTAGSCISHLKMRHTQMSQSTSGAGGGRKAPLTTIADGRRCDEELLEGNGLLLLLAERGKRRANPSATSSLQEPGQVAPLWNNTFLVLAVHDGCVATVSGEVPHGAWNGAVGNSERWNACWVPSTRTCSRPRPGAKDLGCTWKERVKYRRSTIKCLPKGPCLPHIATSSDRTHTISNRRPTLHAPARACLSGARHGAANTLRASTKFADTCNFARPHGKRNRLQRATRKRSRRPPSAVRVCSADNVARPRNLRLIVAPGHAFGPLRAEVVVVSWVRAPRDHVAPIFHGE